MVGEPPGEDEPMDIPANVSCVTPSSCMIIDMFEGNEGKIDDAPLMRFRLGGTNPSALSSGVSGVNEAGSGEDAISA